MNNRSNIVLFAVLGVGALFMLIVAGMGFSSYNGLIEKQEAVEQSWSQVLNVYQRRADLIPNLVETVKGAADFEKSTLTEIAEARANIGKLNVSAETLKDEAAMKSFMQNQQALSSGLGRLMVQAENYPQLRANENFQALMAELAGAENRIAVERKKFNETVQTYNTSVRKFPGSLFAGIFGFEKAAYFEGEKGIEKAPSVKF